MIWNAITVKFIGAVLVGTLVGAAVQQIRIYRLKSQLSEIQVTVSEQSATITVLTEANATCALHVKTQANAIKVWKDDQAQREIEAAKKIQAAEKRAATVDAKAKALRTRAMPNAGNACASLEALLDEAIVERK